MYTSTIIDDLPEVLVADVNDNLNGNYGQLRKPEAEAGLRTVANRHRSQISGLLVTPFLHEEGEDKALKGYGVHIHVIPRHSALTSDSPTMRRLRAEVKELFETHHLDTEFSLALLRHQELPIHLQNPASEALLRPGEILKIENMLERSFSARKGAMVG